MPKKNLTYFIDKFEAIPEKQWTMHTFHRVSDNSYCALGHLGARSGVLADQQPEEVHILNRLVNKHSKLGDVGYSIPGINDGLYGTKYGKTPKTRVVNFLKDLRKKANQEKKVLKKQVKATKKDVKQLFTEIMGKAGLDKSDNVVEKVMQELQTVDWGKK